MASANNLWDSSNLRNYNLELEQIPRLYFKDPKIDDYIAASKPVVILDSDLIKPAQEKWNLEYLEQNLNSSGNSVCISKNHKFKYYDDDKILSRNNPKGVRFTPATIKAEMKVPDFIRQLKEWKAGDDRVYLQQPLNSSVGHTIVKDFLAFNWAFVVEKQTKHNWGPLTSNLLLVSMEGNVTPCHYDEQQNFFAQVHGYKRCILFSPDKFNCLYPHPVHHPHDRQSMVDFDQPDYNKFPKFRDIKGFEAIIGPGEVLYIPVYWWHHIESLMNLGPTITINFWYKQSATLHLEYPLKDYQKVSIMRNIEKMLLEVLQDPEEVGPLLRSMVYGRFNE